MGFLVILCILALLFWWLMTNDVANQIRDACNCEDCDCEDADECEDCACCSDRCCEEECEDDDIIDDDEND